jgi:hypothetical protein
MNQNNAITTHESNSLASARSSWDFDELWRAANAFAGSRMVPEHFQDEPQDCFVVVQLALQLGIAPLTALQNIFMIGKKPGFSAKLAIALANRSGAFAGPIRYNVDKGDGKPESLAVTAYAPTHDGDVVEVTISMQMARLEGWTKNNKYKTIPEQMLRLRSAKWLIDLHCPEILLGLDIHDGDIMSQRNNITPVDRSSDRNKTGQSQSLQQAIEQQKNNAVEAGVITEESKTQQTIAEPQASSDEIREETNNE